MIALDTSPATTQRIAAYAAEVGNRRAAINRPLLESGLANDSIDLA